MKKLFQIGLLLWLAANATAQENSAQNQPKVLRTYDWKDLAGQIPNSQIISMDGMSVLKIEDTNDNSALVISLLKIKDPSVIKKTYFFLCELKYKHEDVPRFFEYGSSLKLLSYLPPAAIGGDEQIIEQSGTRGKQGDMSTSESNWRPCELAVERNASEGLPTQLEVRLSFEGRGTVYLRPIKLFGMASSWWSPQQSGWIGGIGGSLIGCFGGLIGLLAGKGKARNFVLTSIKISIALGILLTIAGLVAVVSKQPYAVWYALLLPGVILTLVFSLNLPSIQRRYDELEIRRMTSVDALGS